MTIAKAVVTGTVFRTTEKRFTQNDFALYSLVIDIGEKEETLLRVVSRRSSLDSVLMSLSKGDKILVEGRLQTNNVKSDDGSERKIFELDATTIELMGEASNKSVKDNDSVVEFAQDEFTDELIAEDEVPF